MAEAKAETEPSIEEILESIRQIISEDGSEASKKEVVAAPPSPPPSPPAPALSIVPTASIPTDPVDDVLDLTEKVDAPALDFQQSAEMGAAVELELESTAAPDVMEFATIEPETPAPETYLSEIPALETTEPAMIPSASDDLLSNTVADAASAAMAKLLDSNTVVERDDPNRANKVTLEDIARDLMRPLVKSWLDQNLPRVIEEMVQKEIEKISKKAGG